MIATFITCVKSGASFGRWISGIRSENSRPWAPTTGHANYALTADECDAAVMSWYTPQRREALLALRSPDPNSEPFFWRLGNGPNKDKPNFTNHDAAVNHQRAWLQGRKDTEARCAKLAADALSHARITSSEDGDFDYGSGNDVIHAMEEAAARGSRDAPVFRYTERPEVPEVPEVNYEREPETQRTESDGEVDYERVPETQGFDSDDDGGYWDGREHLRRA
jgi:hypothetical protein